MYHSKQNQNIHVCQKPTVLLLPVQNWYFRCIYVVETPSFQLSPWKLNVKCVNSHLTLKKKSAVIVTFHNEQQKHIFTFLFIFVSMYVRNVCEKWLKKIATSFMMLGKRLQTNAFIKRYGEGVRVRLSLFDVVILSWYNVISWGWAYYQ